jgi:hypothetical protein
MIKILSNLLQPSCADNTEFAIRDQIVSVINSVQAHHEAPALLRGKTYATLSKANLSGATVTNDQLPLAESLKDIVMPDGIRHTSKFMSKS